MVTNTVFGRLRKGGGVGCRGKDQRLRTCGPLVDRRHETAKVEILLT